MSRLTNGRQSVAARAVLGWCQAFEEARKHRGSGVPLPPVASSGELLSRGSQVQVPAGQAIRLRIFRARSREFCSPDETLAAAKKRDAEAQVALTRLERRVRLAELLAAAPDARYRNGSLALRLAERVYATIQEPENDVDRYDALAVLAVADAENGPWPQAVRLQVQAIERYREAVKLQNFSHEFIPKLEARLEEYQRHRQTGSSAELKSVDKSSADDGASPPNVHPVVQFLLEEFSEGDNAVTGDAFAWSPPQLWRVHCRQTPLNTFL